MQRYHNLIGGQWLDGSSGESVENRNPADSRQVLGTCVFSSIDDVDRAVEAALKAYPAWRATPAPQRGRVIFKALEILRRDRLALGRALTTEEGKILPEALGEMDRAANIIEHIAGEGRRSGGMTVGSDLPKTLSYTVREPLGVVGLITPWNFPVAIPIWKIAPALVAGNTAVLKPSELTPDTACRVGKIFEEAGVPPGVLNIVHGGREIGERLIHHPKIAAISFTGSTPVGLRIYAEASKSGKRVQCEMGGKNAIVVLADADLPQAVDAAVLGAFGSTGQRCTATSRVIVVESAAEAFVDGVVSKARALKIGNGLEDGIQVGPAVSEAQLRRVLAAIEAGKSQARLLCGGKRLLDGGREHGYFVEPTVFDGVAPASALAQEEIFGPVLSVIRVKDLDEAIAVNNRVDFGLSASIYTESLVSAQRFIDAADVGIVQVNRPTIGGEGHMPFGGNKATGIGPRELGPHALHFFTHEKAVYLDWSGRR